jgi:hypothetical protein
MLVRRQTNQETPGLTRLRRAVAGRSPPPAGARLFDVKAYGAAGDGKTTGVRLLPPHERTADAWDFARRGGGGA